MHELEHDVTRLSRLTNHLLLLARDEGAMKHVPVDLAQLVGDGVDRARSEAPDTVIDFEAQGGTLLLEDPYLLTHLIDNLLANAIRHGQGAPVAVKVHGGEASVKL